MDLENRLVAALDGIDVRAEPARLAEGARLLDEVQRHEAEAERLRQRVAAFTGTKTTAAEAPRGPYRSLADWSFSVLRRASGPLHYRDIAAAIQAEGFRHSRPPKNPKQQLSDSVWTAMYEDPRFIKVARGVWDLRER